MHLCDCLMLIFLILFWFLNVPREIDGFVFVVFFLHIDGNTQHCNDSYHDLFSIYFYHVEFDEQMNYTSRSITFNTITRNFAFSNRLWQIKPVDKAINIKLKTN